MALAQSPTLLLLDEPLAGLSAPERQTIAALLTTIPREVTILMIEHDMRAALRVRRPNHACCTMARSRRRNPRQRSSTDPRTREIYLGH